LRMSIGLRGMAQKNPKQEYKREAFEMFERLLANVQALAARVMYALTIREKPEPAPAAPAGNLQYRHDEAQDALHQPGDSPPPSAAPLLSTPRPVEEGEKTGESPGTFRRAGPKVRRNDPCPCGSGKKYKQCHGRI